MLSKRRVNIIPILFLLGAAALSILIFSIPNPVYASNPTPTLTNSETLQAREINLMDSEQDSSILLTIEIIVGLLLVASLVAIITDRVRVPYTAGLVLIGLVLALVGNRKIDVSPELFLSILVPPLIFEAAFQVKARDLLKSLAPILSLAIPGVLTTTFLVGIVLHWGTHFSLVSALIFGSLIAATDPVAVVALFRSLGVPHRLLLLLEGESLFNDGTAIVLFNLMLSIAATGYFSIGESLLTFFKVAGGGLLTGLLLGWLISQAISIIDNALIETTLTTVLAYGAYLVAEQLHFSGVLAVVSAGIISGNLGPSRMAPTTRILVFNFWNYAAFLANSFAFLLLGLQIDLGLLITDWQSILWAIAAVLAARAAVIYGTLWIYPKIPRRFKHVLYWGGLRGAISLALALSLPASLGSEGDLLRVMAFGVVLFTLVIQGLTMKPLINRMDLITKSPAQEEYENINARTVMSRTALNHLETMYQDGFLSKPIYDQLSVPVDSHTTRLVDAATKAVNKHPEVESSELGAAIKEALASERAALQKLLRDKKISESTFSKLAQEIDASITKDQKEFIRYIQRRALGDVVELLAIVIQEKDLKKISSLLEPAGFPITQISSTGGFLGRKNVTLLIGIPRGKEGKIKSLLQQVAETDIELNSPTNDHVLESKPGMATLFSIAVERYEEL